MESRPFENKKLLSDSSEVQTANLVYENGFPAKITVVKSWHDKKIYQESTSFNWLRWQLQPILLLFVFLTRHVQVVGRHGLMVDTSPRRTTGVIYQK